MNKTQAREVIKDVALRLGTKPEWLDALINFETAGTYNPTLDANPYSSARGLIQVIDSTARDKFGVNDSLELIRKYPEFKSQMYNVVLPYLKDYAPYPTKQSLYMAVFYPKYRFVNPTTEFPPYVKKVNPGIETVQDYIDFVDERIKKETLFFPKKALSIVTLALIGGGLWVLMRQFS